MRMAQLRRPCRPATTGVTRKRSLSPGSGDSSRPGSRCRRPAEGTQRVLSPRRHADRGRAVLPGVPDDRQHRQYRAGINFLLKFAKASDFALYVAVISAILLALISGTGRAFVGWVSDYFGRKQTLLAVCVILALSSYGVGWAGSMQNEALFITFAIISGFGGGAFYPLFAALTPDYFG